MSTPETSSVSIQPGGGIGPEVLGAAVGRPDTGAAIHRAVGCMVQAQLISGPAAAGRS